MPVTFLTVSIFYLVNRDPLTSDPGKCDIQYRVHPAPPPACKALHCSDRHILLAAAAIEIAIASPEVKRSPE